jgi:hypothetical protein
MSPSSVSPRRHVVPHPVDGFVTGRPAPVSSMRKTGIACWMSSFERDLDGCASRVHGRTMRKQLGAALMVAMTTVAFSGTTSFAWYRAAQGPRECCRSHCPHRRPASEAPAPCCRQAPPAPIVRHAPAPEVSRPSVAACGSRPEQRLASQLPLAQTAVVGHIDRTLLTQRTSWLH